MAEDRPQLKRRAHRGQMKKLCNKADAIVAQDNITPSDVDLLTCTIEGITSKLELLQTLDDRIISTVQDGEEYEALIIEADDYTTTIREQLTRYKSVLRHINATEVPDNASLSVSTSTEPTSNHTRKVNLPKLTLTPFHGDILQWQSFIDSFQAAVGHDTSLDNIQKFQYLKTQLCGDAEKVIEGLALTNANYTEAMNLLQDRYGQPHKVRNALMKALWKLPEPNEELDSLRTFFDRLQGYIRGLDAMGKKEDSYGDLLVPIIQEKLPGTFRRLIAREHGNREWTLTDLKQCIRKEIDAMEAGDVTSITSDSHVPCDTLATTQAFLTHASKHSHAGQPRQKSCAFCKASHFSTECTKVTNTEKRMDIVKRDHLCFNCLGRHKISSCKSTKRCRNCHKKHHTTLCKTNENTTTSTINAANPGGPTTGVGQESVLHVNSPTIKDNITGAVLLKTAIAEITADTQSPSNTALATILFDEGATRSFITRDLARKLDLKPIGQTKLQITAFGNNQEQRTLDFTRLTVKTKVGSQVAITALIIPTITAPIHNCVTTHMLQLPHLRGLTLAHPASAQTHCNISVLIGADFYWSFVGDHVVRGNTGPTAVESKLGYLLSGPVSREYAFSNDIAAFHVMAHTATTPLEQPLTLERFWNLETIGIMDDATTNNSHHDLETFRHNYIERHQNHYVAKLPWKSDHPPLPTNRNITETRTRRMVQKLSPDTLQIYNRVIKEQEIRGFIEHITNDDDSSGHYIPHHAVKKDSITTPIRVVFDCSCAKSRDSPSLNDCLEKGPELLNDLVSILLRFRIPVIAYSSDIEKAFLHIGLHERDRDFTKFLWLSNPEDPNSDFTVYRFTSVLFGSVSSPAILNAVLRTHLEDKKSHIAKRLANNIYVDNVISGTDSDTQAVAHYHDANEIIESGGFKLRSWSSNSAPLRDLAEKDGVLHPDPIAPVLGLKWDTTDDALTYKSYSHSLPPEVVTKRDVVKRISSLYDPLGLLAPTHVKGKIFVQTLWKEELAWDQPLPDQLQQTWQDIEQQLLKASEIRVPRRYFQELQTTESVTLHCFVDASTKAYGATIFLRQQDNTSLVIAKNRVAPIKALTLPRLELMAALVGARLAQFVHHQLKGELIINEKILWSDSQIVLSWLQSKQHLPTFVRNRVTEIKSVKFDAIRYCPTKQNPADLLTRGIDSNALQASTLWWHGPCWLKVGDWPISRVYDSSIDHDSDDLPTLEHVHVTNTQSTEQGIAAIMKVDNFTSLKSLRHITAWILRFVHNLKNPTSKISDNVISAGELLNANKVWIKAIQTSRYAREIKDLQAKQANPLARQLKLFLDQDGILKCGGRLQHAPIPEDAKFPVLLPPGHPYTRMLITDAHEKTIHSGVQATVTLLRQTYWITRIRAAVRNVIKKCFTCRWLAGPAYQPVLKAPLPEFRLHKAPPFTVTGVDFTGELYVKTTPVNTTSKCYVCLFTCANTRAIHLELVPDLTVKTFLQAFRRFCARRSTPHKVISDNATTYQGAHKELRRLFTNPQVRQYMTAKSVDWIFIPKRAPWWGGFYERLIGLTKKSIQKVLGRRFVTSDELDTILCEVEAAINDRPLTYVYSELSDNNPLTPSQLLHGRQIITLPYEHAANREEILDPSYGSNPSELIQRNRLLGETIDKFWTVWATEYLTALRERHDLHNKHESTQNVIKPGDIVLVHADNRKRPYWDLAVVESLIIGRDGLARAANIKTKSGHTNRPITKLYPLEISTDAPGAGEKKSPNNKGNTPGYTRPKRQAALQALDNIKACLID